MAVQNWKVFRLFRGGETAEFWQEQSICILFCSLLLHTEVSFLYSIVL